MSADKAAKLDAITKFFAAYATYDLDAMRAVMTDDIEWTIPGHHPLAGVKRGVEEVAAFFTALGKAGFQADPLFLEANDEYVVDVHRGWTTAGEGKVDTLWALLWHFDDDGRIDRVVNLSADQHQMDSYIWANYTLAALPDRLA
ncbi:nuclear transport factor 2 family protein [Actinosynnema sp. CA-299493]